MKKKLHNYADSSAYRKWVLTRDKALEQLHLNAQLRSTDVMRKVLSDILLLAKANFHSLKNHMQSHTIDQFEKHVHEILRAGGDQLYQITVILRSRTYLLSMASETEILAQLNPKQTIKNQINSNDLIQKRSEQSIAGGPLFHRIQLYMDRLSRKIVNQVQASAINAPDQDAFLLDILSVFPRRNVYKRPPRVLKPTIKEADVPRGTKVDVAIDFIDEHEWQDMLYDYLNDYVPQWRAPEYIVDISVTDPTITATGEEVWYAWEFERDLTQEFVQSVRDGQVEAANKLGITDFVWMAVIDGSTCDHCCGDYGCRDFDGKLLSEIEEMTGGDVNSCPAHFNCRCSLAPATKDIPDQPSLDDKDFSDWLNS